ncbi:MAG: type II toxin-antitoxin system VapC family toxin [Candidatus Solibacter usitatus]|nr:type II toxin-antitoxin system VapC family toxin [Candidatus Solibacter usitatus]
MKVILDTCTFLWVTLDSRKLSSQARHVFQNPENEMFLSAVSCWEIAVKHSLGRLKLRGSPDAFVVAQREAHGIASLPLLEAHALYESRLPKLHNDPFDRMLICQAILHGCAILTPDQLIGRYPIHSIW